MAVIRRKYDPSVISKRVEKLGLTDREFRELVIKNDPEGKGLSLTTCRKAKAGGNLTPQTICLICFSLGITPESTFVKS